MKYLCIDYGLVRTGIAVSDAGGRMAFPRTTIQRPAQSTKKAFFEKLLAVIDAEAPQAIVVGLPLLHDGTDSLTTKQVRNFVESLQRRCPLPIHFVPEYLSSEEAASTLNERGIHGIKQKNIIDQQAAVHILESFIRLVGA